MFDALRLRYLLKKARKLALLADMSGFLGAPSFNTYILIERLQGKIVRLQDKTHTLAQFDAVVKEYFPDIRMEPLVKPKVERKTFKSLKRT